MADTKKIRILDTIDKPCDLKDKSTSILERLAVEIREDICNVVSSNGGHLAPSLGVVELTIALHAVFDCPLDKFVWDVGHQSYAHKILTGRKDRFHTIRTEDGLSGFPRISESEYDAFGTGHAGTAISAALGLAAARDLKGTDENIVAVVGDGSMTCGLTFEGLNNAGASHRDLLVILNDNKMSISSSVGALAKYFTDVISADMYNKLKKDIWDLTGHIPKVKEPVRNIIGRVEKSLKTFLVPGVWFERLGFRYFGPVDGHDIAGLTQILKQIRKLEGPLLLHVLTTKGKGYGFAEENATRFHGVQAFELRNGKTKTPAERPSYSKVFGDTMVTLADRNDHVCAITAAMTDSTGLLPFAERFPERFFDVGIAEGHAVTFAAGLAREGMKPFVALYSSFLQRSYDNIIHDVALQRLPVVFCIDRAGLVGEDGPTHHGVFDLTFLRHIPGLVVAAPRDENELRDMLNFAASYADGPMAIRYPRGTGSASRIRKRFRKIEPFCAEILRDGDGVALLGAGTAVDEAVRAATILADDGIEARVVNMRFIHPLDTDILDMIISEGIPIVTVEENIAAGGFGSAVLEYVAAHGGRNIIRVLGVPDEYVDHASRSRQIVHLGLDAASIAASAREVIA
jgi:1-deoxy-D-xylulose-5-phosphate synthase